MVAFKRFVGGAAALALLLTACGSDDDGGDVAGVEAPVDATTGDADAGGGSDDATAEGGDADTGLPPEVELPIGFPSSFPIPDDAVVTSGTRPSETPDGRAGYLVTFYSEMPTEDIVGFYQDELPGAGWTVAEPRDIGETRYLEFSVEADPDTFGSVSIETADVEGYQVVDIALNNVEQGT